jgi:hypothetical protein
MKYSNKTLNPENIDKLITECHKGVQKMSQYSNGFPKNFDIFAHRVSSR